jgi:hypothetical protein
VSKKFDEWYQKTNKNRRYKQINFILQSIPKEAFDDRFQKLYEHCQQCVVKDGDYFEGQ